MLRFGEKLRTLRQSNAMTQRGLAEALGYISQGYINELETGRKKPTAELILKVADLFHISTDQLMRDALNLDLNMGVR